MTSQTHSKQQDDSSCLTLEKLGKYINAELANTELLHAKSHIASCDFCSDALDGLMSLPNIDHAEDAVASLNTAIIKRLSITTKAVPLRWKYGTVAAAMVVASIFFFFPRHDSFETLPHLEYLANQYQPRASQLEVVSPTNDAEFKGTVKFEWHTNIKPLILEILNNREHLLETVKVQSGEFTYGRHLAPGLYYWKLLSGEELLHVGKFRVSTK